MNYRQELIQNPDLYRSRAVGCLSGLAIGDTMGELARSEYYRERYGIILSLIGENQSTDDTEFALLTAKIVLSSRGFLTEESVHEAWMQYVVERGIQSRAGKVSHGAVANLKRGMRAPLSGQFNYDFYDDGAAMRTAPIGIAWAGDPETAAEMARIDAQISHGADGIWGAMAIAASVAVAMAGRNIDEIIATGLRYIPQDSWLFSTVQKALEICDDNSDLLTKWERLHDELWTPSRSSNPEALPQVYAIFKLFGKEGFRQCIAAASNFGRDADTLGAIVGALTGALYGMEAIPPKWIEMTRKPRGVCLPFTSEIDIVETACELADLVR